MGGGIRNPMLGMDVSGEIDIASPYSPKRVMQIGRELGFSAIPIKLDHGTVMLVKGEEKYEITTLRHDIDTDGRWAVVRYTRSWRRDAYRRDFTINSLYMDHNKKIYDYTGGLLDIEERRLRFVGDPLHRVREDFLRIIRLFRFWAQCGVPPSDTDISQACSLKDGLDSISKERILAEMLKLYSARDPWDSVDSMYKNGVVVTKDAGLHDVEKRVNHILTPFSRLFCTVDAEKLPLSKEQRQWSRAISVPASKFSDLIVAFHKYGRSFALDYAALYMPEEFVRIKEIHELPKFPLSPSELPVEPGPEMGRRYKILYEWWSEKFPCPSRDDVLQEYERVWGCS